MKIRLLHPLWTHIPVLGLLVYLAARLIMAGSLPASVPTHFGLNGEPNAYGSPWLLFGTTFGISILFGILSIVFDEIWVKSEKRKSFNWISLFDELTAGLLVGISLGYLQFLESGTANFKFPLSGVLVTMGAALGMAVILELLRPFRLNPQIFPIEDTSTMEKELQQRLRDNRAFRLLAVTKSSLGQRFNHCCTSGHDCGRRVDVVYPTLVCSALCGYCAGYQPVERRNADDCDA